MALNPQSVSQDSEVSKIRADGLCSSHYNFPRCQVPKVLLPLETSSPGERYFLVPASISKVPILCYKPFTIDTPSPKKPEACSSIDACEGVKQAAPLGLAISRRSISISGQRVVGHLGALKITSYVSGHFLTYPQKQGGQRPNPSGAEKWCPGAMGCVLWFCL